MKFLTVEQAAKRVDRSERTIGRWVTGGLQLLGGYIREDELLATDKRMRERRGRPKKTAFGMVVLADIHAERLRQNAKWGEQNHPDGTGPRSIPLYDQAAELRLHGSLNDVTLGYADELATAAKAATDHAAQMRPARVNWRLILLEEVFEALAESDPVKLRTELVQVAAVAAQWAEAIDRRPNGDCGILSAGGDERCQLQAGHDRYHRGPGGSFGPYRTSSQEPHDSETGENR